MTDPAEKYLSEFAVTSLPPGRSFTSAWTAPSNIALVKYWGKREGQLPANPSLSMTLSEAVTHTAMRAESSNGPGGVISVNGDRDHPFLPKLRAFTTALSQRVPLLSQLELHLTTENTFPHSAGIASSASGIAAFTLCLLDILQEATGISLEHSEFLVTASAFARLGSGSACRSMYEGFTVWGATGFLPGSSDTFAVPLTGRVHPAMPALRDAILIVSSGRKGLSSTAGHALMTGHPFASARYNQARQNLEGILGALSTNDLENIIQLTESEALTLHALLMTSQESGLLLLPQSLELVHHIRKARKQGFPVFFTIDAGPNIHLLYPEDAAGTVEPWIRDQLIDLCQDGRVIYDRCGKGPVKTG